MTQDPRDALRKIQEYANNARRGAGGFPGGQLPKGAGVGGVGLALLLGGVYAVSQSLFNGK